MKGVAALEAIGADPTRWTGAEHQHARWAFRTNAHAELDRRLLFPALLSLLYSLVDLATLFQGFQWSTAQMFSELMAYDAWRLGTRFEVPFFLFQGETDVITLTTLAEEYFEEVEAPTKGKLIRDAGHFAASPAEAVPGRAGYPGSSTDSRVQPASMREP